MGMAGAGDYENKTSKALKWGSGLGTELGNKMYPKRQRYSQYEKYPQDSLIFWLS